MGGILLTKQDYIELIKGIRNIPKEHVEELTNAGLMVNSVWVDCSLNNRTEKELRDLYYWYNSPL